MNNGSHTAQRGIYLRKDALHRIAAPLGLRDVKLNKRQQAALLGMSYANFWRVVAAGRRVTDLNIADILHAADQIAAERGGPKLGFDDLFEIRRSEPADAQAA